MAKKYTGLNLARVQVPTTIDTTGLSKGILEAEKFKYEEKEAKRKEALEFLKPEATFRPYQQSANRLLTDALAKMSKSETYDPAEYAKVAADYSELINLGNAFETNLRQVSNALMQDPEVNSDLAIPSLYSQYIKTGTADELRQNANKPIDPGEMIGSLGGSKLLKQDVVLSNRLKTIGEITRAIASQGKWKEIFPGLGEAAAMSELTQAASIVDVDTQGNPYIKDLTSPLATTALKVMLTENRVARIVDDSLNAKGIQQPTPDERVEELRTLLAPYASYTKKQETSAKTSRFATPSSSGDGGGGGGAYISLWMQDLTSGDPIKESRALDYIRAGEKLNIAALPTDAISFAINEETIRPTLWQKFIKGSGPTSVQNIERKDRDALIQELSNTGEITGSEIIVGQKAFGQDPNQKYLKIKLRAGNPIVTGAAFEEFYDVYIPLNTLTDPSQSMPLYKSAYDVMGGHYGVNPGTFNINQYNAPPPRALGGEIDVDTKFSDFQGTETVKDLIGGFAKGGDIGMSVFDLIKKKMNEGGTLPETELPEVTVTAEAPNWLQYKREFMSQNPFNLSQYVEERVNQPQTGRAAYKRIDENEFRKSVAEQGKRQYEAKMYDYIQNKLVESNPQQGLPRGEWLDTFSEKEQKILTRNPRYQPTYITDFKRSVQTMFEKDPTQTFYNILNSNDFSTKEKQDLIMQHIENPIVSKLAEAAGIFAPLSMGSKMVQSTYRDDTTFLSALQGMKNNASIIEDIITDITTFVGPGTAAKFKNLLRADRIDDAAKVLSQVSRNLPEETLSVVDDFAKEAGSLTSSGVKSADVIANRSVAQASEPITPQPIRRVEEPTPNVSMKEFKDKPLIEKKYLSEINKKINDFSKDLVGKQLQIKNATDESNILKSLYENFYDSDTLDLNHVLQNLFDFVESRLSILSNPNTLSKNLYSADMGLSSISDALKAIDEIAKNAQVVDPKMKVEFAATIRAATDKLNEVKKLAEEAIGSSKIDKVNESKKVTNRSIEGVRPNLKIEEVEEYDPIMGLKNYLVQQEGDAYYKALSNPESIERMKNFDKEYDTNIFELYNESKDKWEKGKTAIKNRIVVIDDLPSGIKGKVSFESSNLGEIADIRDALRNLVAKRSDIEKGYKEFDDLTKQINQKSKELNKYQKVKISKDLKIDDYHRVIWHELSHDITANVVRSSSKLRDEIWDIIDLPYKQSDIQAYNNYMVKHAGFFPPMEVLKDQMLTDYRYILDPTEFWSWLSTNLRQQLVESRIFKSHLDTLNSDMLDKAIKENLPVLFRFNVFIKDKQKFIDLFNKMTLTTVPLVMKYINEYNNEPNR